jgi:hypothetical protein
LEFFEAGGEKQISTPYADIYILLLEFQCLQNYDGVSSKFGVKKSRGSSLLCRHSDSS